MQAVAGGAFSFPLFFLLALLPVLLPPVLEEEGGSLLLSVFDWWEKEST
jgi:hypothetical protein